MTSFFPLPARAGRTDGLRFLALCNIALLLLLWLAETFVAERHWLAGMLTYLPQQIYALPTLSLLAWSLWRKRRIWLIANSGVALFFLFQFLGFNLPWRAVWPASTLRAPRSQRTLRVMSYNILLGLRGDKNLLREIEAQRPDVVCLQEAAQKTGYPDAVETIYAALPGWFLARGAEVTTLSRFPIVEQKLHPLPRPSRRQILETAINADGRKFTLLNVHLNTLQFRGYPQARTLSERLTRSNRQRREQAEVLHRVAAEINGPLLICGDFNTPPRGLIYQRLARRFQDSFRFAGWGFGYTFHSDLPVIRIDYIWSSRHFTPHRCFVPASRASDHRPLVADLSF